MEKIQQSLYIEQPKWERLQEIAKSRTGVCSANTIVLEAIEEYFRKLEEQGK